MISAEVLALVLPVWQGSCDQMSKLLVMSATLQVVCSILFSKKVNILTLLLLFILNVYLRVQDHFKRTYTDRCAVANFD